MTNPFVARIPEGPTLLPHGHVVKPPCGQNVKVVTMAMGLFNGGMPMANPKWQLNPKSVPLAPQICRLCFKSCSRNLSSTSQRSAAGADLKSEPVVSHGPRRSTKSTIQSRCSKITSKQVSPTQQTCEPPTSLRRSEPSVSMWAAEA